MKPTTENRDRIIAASLTMLSVLLMLLALFFGALKFDRATMANASMPEIQDDEPIFIEPLLTNFGEEDAITEDEAAPAAQGEPLPDNETQTRLETEGTKTPKPTPTSSAPSSKPNVNPDLKNSEKERRAATDAVASAFATGNGSSDSSAQDASGAGGNGSGVTGSAKGRTFISCPHPDVTLRHKTTVTVNIVIDAQGRVTEATATGGADPAIRQKCVQAALKARWSEKKGASPTRGTITFTITPR